MNILTETEWRAHNNNHITRARRYTDDHLAPSSISCSSTTPSESRTSTAGTPASALGSPTLTVLALTAPGGTTTTTMG